MVRPTQGLVRGLASQPVSFFKNKNKNFMIKLLMLNKFGNFNKFTKLNKDFVELNDKLIIKYFLSYSYFYFDIYIYIYIYIYI